MIARKRLEASQIVMARPTESKPTGGCSWMCAISFSTTAYASLGKSTFKVSCSSATLMLPTPIGLPDRPLMSGKSCTVRVKTSARKGTSASIA